MFGVEELEAIRDDVDEAIQTAIQANKRWLEKRKEIEKLVGKETMAKIGTIVDI